MSDSSLLTVTPYAQKNHNPLGDGGLRVFAQPIGTLTALEAIRAKRKNPRDKFLPGCFERTQVMKRILLSVVAIAALALGGVFASTAEAHGPYCGYRGYAGRGYGMYN